MGYVIYGRNQRAIVPLLSGIALIVFPYVVSNVAWLLIVGITLCAIPYFIRL